MRSFRTPPLVCQSSWTLRCVEPAWTAQYRSAHTDPLKSAQDFKVFRNSLVKTLEAHRSANRASLFRRVPGISSSLEIENDPTAPPNVEETRENSQTTDSNPDLPLEASPKPSNGCQQRQEAGETSRAPTGGSQGPADSAIEVDTWTEINAQTQLRWNASGDERPVQLPWLQHLPLGPRQKHLSAYLSREIQALDTYLTPSPREIEAVELIISEISRHLAEIAPNGLELIGSRRTGMAVSHSDINLGLATCPPQPPADSTHAPRASPTQTDSLVKARDILGRVPSFRDFAWTGSRREPLLEFNHDPTGLHVQLRCSGTTQPQPFDTYIEEQQMKHPLLRPLYKTVRLLLETQGLFGVHRSSVTPRALLMLVLAHLKLNPDRYRLTTTGEEASNTPSSAPNPASSKDSIGLHLLVLLDTFGHKVDLQTTGVSISPPGFFTLRTVEEIIALYKSSFHPSLVPLYIYGQRVLMNHRREASKRRYDPRARSLCIQCPLNPARDVGSTCHRPVELGVVFARAHDELLAAVQGTGAYAQQQQQQPQQLPGGMASRRTILGSVLRANFQDFQRLRKRVVRYAESVNPADSEMKSPES